MTAHEFWERHPSLQENPFRFAEAYAAERSAETAERWMKRADEWTRYNQQLETRVEELLSVISADFVLAKPYKMLGTKKR